MRGRYGAPRLLMGADVELDVEPMPVETPIRLAQTSSGWAFALGATLGLALGVGIARKTR
jgi:hypothetical protein